MSLQLVHVSFTTACEFIALHHRHHRPPVGHRFSVGVADDEGVLRGVVIVGRPVAASFDDGLTCEVTRSATDGTPHVNSMLYAAAWRAVKAMGFQRLVTYTQVGESGASLRAAGWRVVAERPERPGWKSIARPRGTTDHAGVARTLWEAS